MERTISPLGLLLTSISAIIGSGWLFSAFYTAELAGPASILSWVLGGVFMIIVAFVFAELCSMLPISGSSTRIPHFTHGALVSFVFAWMVWLSYLALQAAEVQAVVQYVSFYWPTLTNASGQLTLEGFISATLLMVFVSAFNVYSLRWLIRCNNLLTFVKFAVPLIMVILILVSFFNMHRALHPSGSNFLPLGFHGMFGAISMGGIMFAFNGFKQAAELAGEAKNPKFSVPFAIVGSVGICLLLYILLQTAFLSSLEPHNLTHGWNHINLGHNSSPFAAIVLQNGMKGLLPVLYFGAVIAPFAAALMYCSSAARSLYGMSHNGYIPAFFQQLSGYGNPLYAIMANFTFSLLLFAPLPGWDKMVNFLSSLLAVTYSVGPISLLALRYQASDYHRPLKLPFGRFWSLLAFYICTLLAYWSGWNTISKMGIAIGIGLLVFYAFRLYSGNSRQTLNISSSTWMLVYLPGLMFFSWLGNFGGGLGLISQPYMLCLLAVFCSITLWLSLRYKLESEVTRDYINNFAACATRSEPSIQHVMDPQTTTK